eukprot:8857488-Pyramimonas_sp.AAC.1
MMEYMVPRTSKDPSEREAKCSMWKPSTAVADRAAYRLEADRRVSAARRGRVSTNWNLASCAGGSGVAPHN